MRKKILYLGNKLAHKGYTPTGIDTLGLRLEQEGFSLRYASSKSSKLLRLIDMLVEVVKSRNWADYVLIDTYSTQSFWYAYLAARFCHSFGLKYIPILHGGNLPQRLGKSPKASRRIFGNSYVNVAPSLYLKRSFQEKVYQNVKLIPNAIDLSLYEFKQRSNLKPKLLWVRSFAEIYNPILAVELVHKLKQQHPEAQLCMIGPDKDGSLKKCKEHAEKLGVQVQFLGKLSREAWCSMAAEYDIFINTTHYDNTPVSLIEAMALGLPVISTEVGGIPYLIRHQENGLLVPDGDAQAFIHSINHLLRDPKLAYRLSESGRATAVGFAWKQVKLQWHKLLS